MTQTPTPTRPFLAAPPGARLVPEDEIGGGALFIDGKFRECGSGEVLPVVNPATGRVVGSIPGGSAADVELAVRAAARALPGWGATTCAERATRLLALATALEADAEGFARLESLDSGKPLPVAREDIGQAVDTFRFMAGAVRAGQGLASGDYVAGRTSLMLREPVGVVGAITPWNYPLLMAVWKLAPILATGNTCVLKPSELTSLSTLRFAELAADLLPPGVLNVVTGVGAEVGQALATHPEVALVSLTGSVRAGRAVASAASATLKRVHLELGGKAPVLVFEDADLDAVAKNLRFAGFWNSGQECGAACRVLVAEAAREDLLAALLPAVESLVVGDPAAGDEVEIGPLVSAAHRDRVVGFVERATSDGARLATGGDAPRSPGYFVRPTVLTDLADGAEATREEIFGPVVTVESFGTEEEAVARANATRYGLAASVWTEHARRALDLPGRLDFGTVWVNDHLTLASEMPWGGFKSSGYGRDLSVHALEDYSRTKHVMINKVRER